MRSVLGHPAKNDCSTEVLLDFCARATFLRSVPVLFNHVHCIYLRSLEHSAKDDPLWKFYVTFVPERHFCGVSRIYNVRKMKNLAVFIPE
jgi:hypothetical protein